LLFPGEALRLLAGGDLLINKSFVIISVVSLLNKFSI
jgi:hypothetical protein